LSVIASCVTPVKLKAVGAVGVGGVKVKILREPWVAEVSTVIAPAV